MGYKTIVEMIEKIKEYENLFQTSIPNDFHVHSDYLIDNLNETDFRKAYERYRQIMQALQLDMAKLPHEYGLIVCDKKGLEKPAYSMNNQYIWLFLALAQSGEIKNGILHIDGQKFADFKNGKAVGKNSTSPKNVDKLIKQLENHSFTINGNIEKDFDLHLKYLT